MVMRARQPGRIAQGGAPAQQHLGLRWNGRCPLRTCHACGTAASRGSVPRKEPRGRVPALAKGGASGSHAPFHRSTWAHDFASRSPGCGSARTAGGSASRPVHFAWARAGSAIGRRSFQCCGAHARSSFPHRSLVHDAGATEGRKKEQDGGLILKKFVAQQFRSQSRASPARGQLCREEDPDLASRLPSSRARPTLGPLPSRPCVGEAHGSKPPLFSKKARSWTF